jgi:hypothetical protein
MSKELQLARKSFFKRPVRVLVSIVVCLSGFVLLVTALMIPPTCGRVVDAITGKPVRDVNVVLQVSTYAGFGVHTEVKHVTSTNRFGWFLLPGSFQWKFPLSDFRGSWLTVNEDKEGSTGGEEGSASTEVLYNPMFNNRSMRVGNKYFFPITVTFKQDGCARVWAATCTHRMFWWGVSFPLIPVLENVEDCKKISESMLREQCRQLNTYRAAFAHVDSYEDAQKGKAFCAQVDHGAISAICLRQLPVYVANPQGYERPIVSSPTVPLQEGMFEAAIGQVPRFYQGCGKRDSFTGHFYCTANYGPKDPIYWVAVTVEEWPDVNSARSRVPVDKPHFADYEEATVKDEVRSDGKIRLYHGPQYTVAYWVSNNRFVQVLFYRPIPEQEEFISHYLSEFPSTPQ